MAAAMRMRTTLLCCSVVYRSARALSTAPPSATTSATAFRAVTLKRGKARLFRDGHPLVYGGAVAEAPEGLAAGELVRVQDGHPTNPRTVGWGTYNPDSMFRVRILRHAGESVPLLAKRAVDEGGLQSLLRARLRAALTVRQAALGLPSLAPGEEHTTAYRLVNGEGDRLSGLCVDVLGPAAIVISVSARWCEVHRAAIEEAVGAVAAEATGASETGAPPPTIYWRRVDMRLKQDGWSLEPAGAEAEAAAAEDAECEVHELGLAFFARPATGQKTGFYCDQRDNRRALRRLVRAALSSSASGECSVLDLCCHTGGFALNAAAAGATSVLGVDSSADAVAAAERNAAHNELHARVRFERAEVSAFMQQLLREPPADADGAPGKPKQYDVVVLDPPKLAPSARTLPKAIRKYRQLNALALRLVRPGGVLLSCSCSAAVAAEPGLLVRTVHEAAAAGGGGAAASAADARTVTVLGVSGAAADHPVHPLYPEGSYLTAVTFCVQ